MNTELPHIDECRYLILKIIEQAVRDYLSLENSITPTDKTYYRSACQFLFDDKFIVEYGGSEKNLKEFLGILGIDLVWFRERVVKLKNERIQEQKEKRIINIDILEDFFEGD